MKRDEFVERANSKLGSPYIWGGKGLYVFDASKGLVAHDFGLEVFDCSGLVTDSLYRLGGKDWRGTHNAQSLADYLQVHITFPKAGDLAFYGPDWKDIRHVMIHRGDGSVIGASGGNSSTTTLEAARKARAEVKLKFKSKYRPDFLGFKSIAPLVEDP